jgi:hypothetical protein
MAHASGVQQKSACLAVLDKCARRTRIERVGAGDGGWEVIEHQALGAAHDMRVIRLGTVVTHEDQNFGCRRHRVGALGAGLRPAPRSLGCAMNRRQGERTSRFQVQIENSVRSAAVGFRDNDVEASVITAIRLWWGSRLRGRRFAQLVSEAREVTQKRISLGVVEQGEPGRRQAMPYFFAVLRDLVDAHRLGSGQSVDRGRLE